MTDQELEILLKERAKSFDLKKTAFESLDKIFSDNSDDKNFLCGYKLDEIETRFDGFEYQIDRRQGVSFIRTRIGLYVVQNNSNDNLDSIGYYELETNLKGEVLDDWFVIEKEKYLKDLGIITHFQRMNDKLPIEYLRRNHIQYEFVSYISLVGTLFVSNHFEGAGRFVMRAYKNLERVDIGEFDKDYIKESKNFLKMMSDYLLSNDLVSDHLKEELSDKKNCG